MQRGLQYFVCLSVCLLQLVWLTWRLNLWSLDTDRLQTKRGVFKLSRFCQEHFVQELCCDSFATASASRPYSSLRTSSHALVWDSGSTIAWHYKRVSASTWACFWYKAHIEGLVWHCSHDWRLRELKFKVFVPKCLYFERVLTMVARSMLGS